MAVLIGLTGEATVGKDELADSLVRNHGYVKMGWADRLYKMALILDPLLEVDLGNRMSNLWVMPHQRLSRIVGKLGWTNAKRIPSVRKYLQVLGTEAVRECLGQDVWIDAMMPDVVDMLDQDINVVITNTRFKNEALAIIDSGGEIARVKRPGVGAVNEHVSDSGEAFSYASIEIENDSTVASLAVKAAGLHESMSRTVRKEITAESAIEDWDRHVADCVGNAANFVISCIMPEGADMIKWKRKHGVEAEIYTEDPMGVAVFADGSEIGSVTVNGDMLTIDVMMAK